MPAIAPASSRGHEPAAPMGLAAQRVYLQGEEWAAATPGSPLTLCH